MTSLYFLTWFFQLYVSYPLVASRSYATVTSFSSVYLITVGLHEGEDKSSSSLLLQHESASESVEINGHDS